MDYEEQQRRHLEHLEDQRVPIQGRVGIKDLAICAQALHKRGVRIETRSELLNSIAEGLAAILTKHDNMKYPKTAEEAHAMLRSFGITWEPGTRAHKRVTKVLQKESMTLDGLHFPSSRRPGSQDVFLEASDAFKQRMAQEREKEHMKKARKGTGDSVAGIPDSANVKDDE